MYRRTFREGQLDPFLLFDLCVGPIGLGVLCGGCLFWGLLSLCADTGSFRCVIPVGLSGVWRCVSWRVVGGLLLPMGVFLWHGLLAVLCDVLWCLSM